MSLSSAGPDLGISQSLKEQSERHLTNIVAREAGRDAERTCCADNSNKLKGENDDKQSFFHDVFPFSVAGLAPPWYEWSLRRKQGDRKMWPGVFCEWNRPRTAPGLFPFAPRLCATDWNKFCCIIYLGIVRSMSALVPKGILERGAANDLWRHTLSQIPAVFGRMVYLAGLRNGRGRYEHHGL